VADTVFETRGHYLFSWTFPAAGTAKAIEQLWFLFSVAKPTPSGHRSFMQHFWFIQKIPPGDEQALIGADGAGRSRHITWAKGSGVQFRTHQFLGGPEVDMEDFIPAKSSMASLSVSSPKSQPLTMVSLPVAGRSLMFKMDQLAATNVQKADGWVISGTPAYSGYTDIYLAGDPWRLPTFLNPKVPKAVAP